MLQISEEEDPEEKRGGLELSGSLHSPKMICLNVDVNSCMKKELCSVLDTTALQQACCDSAYHRHFIKTCEIKGIISLL